MMTDAQVAAQVCVASVVPGALSTAICSGLPVHCGRAHPLSHGHQVTRDHLRRIDPGSGRAATEARKKADRLAVEAWNKRMLGFQGPAQPSPTLGTRSTPGLAISK